MFLKWPDSLRFQLLRWLLAPLLVLLSINAWFSNRAAVSTANIAFDRLLMASAEAIAEDVEFKDGEVVVDLPYAALELLESNLQERIFYRVVAPGGQTATGYEDLPLPPPLPAPAPESTPAPARTPEALSNYYSARYRGETVYLVALSKKLYGTGVAEPVLIIVAETGEAREALSRKIVLEGLAREAVLIAAAGLLVWFGLGRGLRPLTRLRSSVEQRMPTDLSPIDPVRVQTEVRPLIEALNQHTARIERLLSSRQRLITDASHQMRTPLAEMRTQIEYSLRQNRPELTHQTLVDIHADIDHLARLLTQLLLQARADPDGLPELRTASVDMTELARQTALDHVRAARKKAMDLSFEAPCPDAAARVMGNELLLRELIANLIDNAILYGEERGSVTVRVGVQADAGVTLEVEDDGPGIPADERDKVFERFYRSPAAAAARRAGSGLGLSIVRDIGTAHGAKVALLTPHSGVGLCVRVTMASAAARPSPT